MSFIDPPYSPLTAIIWHPVQECAIEVSAHFEIKDIGVEMKKDENLDVVFNKIVSYTGEVLDNVIDEDERSFLKSKAWDKYRSWKDGDVDDMDEYDIGAL